ncbi:MAG: hypothetical protein ACQETM_08375 [Bacteroidota bacterium]
MTTKLKIIPIILLSFSSFAIASNPASSSSNRHSLTEGNRALQFQIGSNFQLSQFQGNVISYKRHRTDHSAWRMGISLGGSLSRSDNETEDAAISGDNINTQEQERKDRDLEITIRPQLQRYLPTSRAIRPYFSYGALAGYSYEYSESKAYSGQQEPAILSNMRENTQHGARAGVTVNYGVEWFATSSISFLAEYGADLYYRYSNLESVQDTYNVGGEQEMERRSSGIKHGLFLSPRPVRFGLSAYF